jgi:hypothetical protein
MAADRHRPETLLAIAITLKPGASRLTQCREAVDKIVRFNIIKLKLYNVHFI